MALVRFTQNIQRHVACPPRNVEGPTVRDILNAYFRGNALARDYVFDEQGQLRRHMAIFIDGEPVLDRRGLADPVSPAGTIDIVQALSGG
ncbi:MAG: MoaD/ThiS family protein [Opitutaceae bacterium]|nr:MoaD/ThiS family protein [Verrucomicrobiales bacterium]MBL9204983.1 MoaD/ThiS family protein [Opitutaceae bacterium]